MWRGGEGDSVEKMRGDRSQTEEKEKEGVRLGLGDTREEQYRGLGQ